MKPWGSRMSREIPTLGFVPRTVIACTVATGAATIGGIGLLWVLGDLVPDFVEAIASSLMMLGFESGSAEATGVTILLTAPQILFSLATAFMANRVMLRGAPLIGVGPGKRVLLASSIFSAILVATATLLIATEGELRGFVNAVGRALEFVIGGIGPRIDEIAAWSLVVTAPAALIASLTFCYVEHRWRRAVERIPADEPNAED